MVLLMVNNIFLDMLFMVFIVFIDNVVNVIFFFFSGNIIVLNEMYVNKCFVIYKKNWFYFLLKDN